MARQAGKIKYNVQKLFTMTEEQADKLQEAAYIYQMSQSDLLRLMIENQYNQALDHEKLRVQNRMSS